MNNSIFHLKGAASGPKSLRPGEGAICGFHWPLRAPLERGAWSRNPEISAPSGLDARLRGHDEKTTQKIVIYTESRLFVKANLRSNQFLTYTGELVGQYLNFAHIFTTIKYNLII